MRRLERARDTGERGVQPRQRSRLIVDRNDDGQAGRCSRWSAAPLAHGSLAAWPDRTRFACLIDHQRLLRPGTYILAGHSRRVSGVAGSCNGLRLGCPLAVNVICETAMTHVSPYDRARTRLIAGWRNRAVTFKAISFAMIGVVNSVVDYAVFLIARALLDSSAPAMALFASVSGVCECGSAAAISLIAANAISWIVAVSGSYIMNSTITF